MELGDLVEKGLIFVGITKEKVSEWLGEECGCQERKEKLNQLSIWAKRVARGAVKDAKEFLELIMSDI